MYEREYGYKYKETSGDAAEIAKKMRADIRQAIQEGLLPAHPSYSVTIDRFSGGQSVDIEVRGWPEAWKPCDRVTCPNAWCSSGGMHRDLPGATSHEILTAEGEAAEMTLKRIHGAYNHDGSESQVDYFDVRYYGRVSFESADTARWRAEQEAKKAAHRAQIDSATNTRKMANYTRNGRVVHLAAEIERDGKTKLALVCGARYSRGALWGSADDLDLTCSRCKKRAQD